MVTKTDTLEATVEPDWSYTPAATNTRSIKLLENTERIAYTLLHKVRLVHALPARIKNITKDLL